MMTTALIFAAGRGERLRPLTDTLPKALCRVRGISLIEHHLTALASAGFKRIVINHAHLGGLIRAQLGDGSRWGVQIIYSPEPPGALETGGGLVNALPHLGHEPFLTVNADIVTDYPFASLQDLPDSPAHLVLVKIPKHHASGDFGLTQESRLSNINRQYTFSGIARYRPEIFNTHRPGRYSITPFLRQLADEQRATAEIYDGEWCDVGTPEQLRAWSK